MTEAEMEAVLDPKLYIGRCPEQVDAFLAQVRPLLSGASREVPEISLWTVSYRPGALPAVTAAGGAPERFSGGTPSAVPERRSREGCRKWNADFVGFDVDSALLAVIHCYHRFRDQGQIQPSEGIDGEKDRGNSGSVSGGSGKPVQRVRGKKTLQLHFERGSPLVSATSCDRYLTRACWSFERDPIMGAN